MMRVLDLCSGIGGLSLGLENAGMQTAAFCEVDKACQKVLRKHWPDVPIHDDIYKLTGAQVGAIDVITAGYPCQPFSLAGKRGGAKDDRHLWPEIFRLIHEIRPTWVICENVYGHVSMGLDAVLSDLEGEGYARQPFVVPAVAVDAPHLRKRVWIVAHAAGERRKGRHGKFAAPGKGIIPDTVRDGTREEFGKLSQEQSPTPVGARRWEGPEPGDICEVMANTTGERCGEAGQLRCNEPEERTALGGEDVADANKCMPQRKSQGPRQIQSYRNDRWPTEPDVGRVAHGVPRRVDRIRGLGNAVVPQIPEIIGRIIIAVSSEETA